MINSKKQEFHEDYHNPKQDPLSPTTQEFDWNGLYDLLGEAERDLNARDYEALQAALRTLCHWALATDLERPGFEATVGRRVVGLLWTIDPAFFEGSPSLTQLAARFKVHKSTLSAYAAAASREFGIRNRGQAHGWNFKAELKRAQHAHNRAVAEQKEAAEGNYPLGQS